jgi:3-methyladenine DNA glycosylase AlkD
VAADLSKVATEARADAIHARLRAASTRTTPGLRQHRRAISRELRAASGSDVLRTAELLIERGGCPRWFAYELVHHHTAAMQALSSAWLDRLGRHLGDWDEVDPFACYLLGPAFREGRISAARIARWARGKDRWRRRAALVATVALNSTARGGSGDAERTLAVCDLLLADRDDMVVKALSWALRELAKKDPKAARRYVRAHGSELAPRVLREVGNKLDTGLKNPKRRA